MYLSRLRLNPTDPDARRDLADAYQLHRTLARVYAADTEQAPARFLWRLERDANRWADANVLVQAATPGRWQALDARPGYLQELQADKAIDLAQLIHPGRRYRFRLHANPTVTRDGKRHGLQREDEQLDWLNRQGQRGGFEVIGAVRGACQQIRVSQGRTGHRISVTGALFDGLLQVTDADSLRHTLTAGIGHAKALGLGMLSIAPVNT